MPSLKVDLEKMGDECPNGGSNRMALTRIGAWHGAMFGQIWKSKKGTRKIPCQPRINTLFGCHANFNRLTLVRYPPVLAWLAGSHAPFSNDFLAILALSPWLSRRHIQQLPVLLVKLRWTAATSQAAATTAAFVHVPFDS